MTEGVLRVKEVSMYGKTDTMHCRGDHWSSGNLGTKLHRQGRLFFLRKSHQLLRHWCAGGESPPLRCMTKLSKNGVIPSRWDTAWESVSKNVSFFGNFLENAAWGDTDCHGPDGPRSGREKLRLLGQTETPAVKTAGVFLMQLGWWGCYASLTWVAKRRKAALPWGVFL